MIVNCLVDAVGEGALTRGVSISSRDVQSGLSAASASDEMELARWLEG